jgi:hypothetical protein
MELEGPEYQTLQTAITALQATAGLKTVKVDVRRPLATDDPNPRADALLAITLNGHKQHFVAEIKAIDRRIAVAQIRDQLQEIITQRYPGYLPLLITTFATPDLAEECRRLDLPSSIPPATFTFRRTHLWPIYRGKHARLDPTRINIAPTIPRGSRLSSPSCADRH